MKFLIQTYTFMSLNCLVPVSPQQIQLSFCIVKDHIIELYNGWLFFFFFFCYSIKWRRKKKTLKL